MAARLNNLTIDATGTEGGAAKNLEVALEMGVEEDGGNVSEGMEGVDGTLR